jgi:eukaryotic-like serine/threonine-protein kinase
MDCLAWARWPWHCLWRGHLRAGLLGYTCPDTQTQWTPYEQSFEEGWPKDLDTLHDDELVGKVLLHYQVTERLGAGGMGVVYRAVDLKLKRTVALKFLSASQGVSGELKERFLREAMASSALDHTNIGTLHAVEETEDGEIFLVMACYAGPTLAERMARGPMTSGEAVGVALQLARGLAEAHAHGIVHRDIKPGNLIFHGRGVLKILDFGLAKLHGSPELTTPGTTLGTAAYMAPEQAMGDPTDARADLWSAGVILHEMLTGRRLFDGGDLRSTMYAVMSKEPEPIAGLPAALEQVLERALKREPDERYQTANAMVADLEVLAGSGVRLGASEVTVTFAVTRPMPTAAVMPPPSGFFRPQWSWLGGALVVLLAVGAGLGWWMVRRRAVAVPGGLRVAVLPLLAVNPGEGENMAPAQALSDGLRGQLIAALADRERSNQGLLVVPAAQMAAQHVTDAASARRALGADVALTGSFSEVGGQVHVVLTAVDTGTAKVMRSETVEGSSANLPALSAKLAETSAKMLGLKAGKETGSGSADALAGLSPAEASTYLASLGYLSHWDDPKSLDAAIAGLEQVVAAAPKFAIGYAALADCYRRRYVATKESHALDLADRTIERAIPLGGELPEVLLSAGEVRLLQGRYPEAVNDFVRVLTIDDRNDGALRRLAEAYASMGLTDKAEDEWQKSIEVRPNSADARVQWGIFEMGRSAYDKAAEEFRIASSLAPGNASILGNLGAALQAAGRLDESRKVLQEAIRIEPNYGSYDNLGNLDLQQGRYGAAAADYEKALELNKSDYHVWSNLAVAYSRTPGEKDRAKDGFLEAAKRCREALKANPNDPVMLSDLAMFVASEGDERQEPLVLIEKALALAPQDTYVQFNAAETYESLGYHKEALDWLEKLVKAGYPLDDINQSPVLAELVKDPRYQGMVAARKK